MAHAQPCCSARARPIAHALYRAIDHNGINAASEPTVSWLYSWLEKMCGTSVKIIKNEVGCRDETVPKTIDTRTSTPSIHLGFWGLRKIVACSQSILLAVPSCFDSFWHGLIPTSYFIFNDFYTCTYVTVYGKRDHVPQKLLWASTALTENFG